MAKPEHIYYSRVGEAKLSINDGKTIKFSNTDGFVEKITFTLDIADYIDDFTNLYHSNNLKISNQNYTIRFSFHNRFGETLNTTQSDRFKLSAEDAKNWKIKVVADSIYLLLTNPNFEVTEKIAVTVQDFYFKAYEGKTDPIHTNIETVVCVNEAASRSVTNNDSQVLKMGSNATLKYKSNVNRDLPLMPFITSRDKKGGKTNRSGVIVNDGRANFLAIQLVNTSNSEITISEKSEWTMHLVISKSIWITLKRIFLQEQA
jgi:hypothetical protein